MIKNKKQFLNESNKVNCHPGGFSDGNFQITKECHPEERSELRFLPVIDDSQERWSDSEHTRLVNESTAGCFRMPKNTEGRGEGRHWQKALQTAALSLALSFFIAAPVCAADTPPVPTLDRVKEENKNFINSSHPTYTLTELKADETATEGSITVKIGDKTYYYTPNEGDNTNTLQLLSATGNAALVETTQDDALYIADGKYYKYEAEKLPDSAYTLTETTVSDPENLPDNVITLYDKTEVIKYYDPTTGEEVAESDRQEGIEYKEVTTIETTPKYYTVSLKQTEYGDKTADSAQPVYFKWTTDADGNKKFTQEGASADDYSIVYYTQTEYGDKTADSAKPVYFNRTPTSSGKPLTQEGATVDNYDIVYYYRTEYGDKTIDGATSMYWRWVDSDGEQELTQEGTTSDNYNIVYYAKTEYGNANTDTTLTYGWQTNSDTSKIEFIKSPTTPVGNIITVHFNASDLKNRFDNTSDESSLITDGVFAEQSKNESYITASGGAILNSGSNAKLGDITADFIGNSAITNGGSGRYATGGAIHNSSDSSDSPAVIGNITGNFIGNFAKAPNGNAQGGAIYNSYGKIGNITGNFIGNQAIYSGGSSHGGAIYNSNGSINNIIGSFIGNNTSFAGGAIDSRNSSTISSIKGDFVGNSATYYGGAIFNGGTIEDITGNFIANTSSAGSAIYNSGKIVKVTGDFVGNKGGAAIYNAGTVNDISANFIGNSNGAILNKATTYAGDKRFAEMGNITGNFIGNYSVGAISNNAIGEGVYIKIGDITGTFIGNYSSDDGGAIAISGSKGAAFEVGNITGDFIGNYSDGAGGAISNYVNGAGSSELKDITGDFIWNYSKENGGAIFNNRKMGSITGNFISNNARLKGGAIYSSGTIGNITGDFIGNTGGAIYSGGTIGNITGDFIGNTGGAIYSSGTNATIGDITGDFINNYSISSSGSVSGGAIYNAGTIGDIAGDFIGNYLLSEYSSYTPIAGGTIYNSGTIGDIIADFVGTHASSLSSYTSSSYNPPSALGGAIYNSGTIGNITGDFIDGYTFATTFGSAGGAIYNGGTIGNITGDFINNYSISSSSSSANGGAISNSGTIRDITGNFVNNYAFSDSTRLSSPPPSAHGGAISNGGTIGNITGGFIGNYTSAFSSSVAEGGAIYNYGTIGDITGDFIGNYVSTDSSYANGGAIYNDYYTTIGDVRGNFIGNYAHGTSRVYGGAIYNDYDATIGDITGDFIGNYALSTESVAYGGAIYNYSGTIGDITGDFIGNYALSTNSSAYGGAIYNYWGTIGDITGDFIGNYASSTGSYAYGGAIYNIGTIGNITGDFIGNYASGNSYANGGAISNGGTIGNITGDFIGNYASGNSYANGGAIYNYGTIGNITGNFIGNYASGNSYAYGGAINNRETIGNITGDFIGNYTQSNSSYALGGAIYNYISSSNNAAIIGLTNNDFLNNYAKSETATAKGGAIFTNYDLTLNADNGNVLISGNYTESNGIKEQNAIYVANYANSSGKISRNTTFTLNAVNNGKIQLDDTISGGAYYYSSTDPNFWETSKHAYTLALTSDGTGTISLYNDVENAKVTAENVTVDFANGETRDYNFVSMTAGENTNLNLDVDFSNKTADTITTQNNSTGTLVINSINSLGTTDGAVTVQIIKNTDSSSALQLDLGDNITEVKQEFVFDKNFVENTEKFVQEGGISLATTDTHNDSITIDVDKLLDTLQLINGYETKEERTFKFTDSSNYMLSEDLSTTTKGTININGLGAETPSTINAQNHTMFNLQNATTLNIKNTTIENAKDFAIKAEHENAVVNLTNTSVKNTTTDTSDLNKAAIQSKVDLNITADAGKSEFSGNKTHNAIYMHSDIEQTSTGQQFVSLDGNQAIFKEESTTTAIKTPTLSLNAKNNGSIIVNDQISGDINTGGKTTITTVVDLIATDMAREDLDPNLQTARDVIDYMKNNHINGFDKDSTDEEVLQYAMGYEIDSTNESTTTNTEEITSSYSVKIDGDKTGKVVINNNINNANISLDNTNLYVGRENVFDNSVALSLNSGTMYLNNNVIGTMHVPTLNLNGNTDLYVDVDLANESMDRVTADKYNVADDAVLNVADLNLISTTEKENVKILFADEPLANNVAYSGDSPISYKGTNVIYSPIYKYTVNYGVDENDKQGYFFFNKATAGIGDGSGSDIGGGAAGNISDSFNPSILAPAVATQAGAYTTQLQTFNYAFQHADTFMNIPYLERISIINQGKYAMSPTADATDVGTFSPLLTKEHDPGFWVKPYASFENVPLKNGPKVNNINYGTLVGYDSPLKTISNGFERVLTGYIGYNGASQRYSGVDAYQNGGLIGGTATFYKGNFFNATTLSVGASAGDASTMYGSENYTMLLAGIGNKTGYNFEFFDGGLILQPNMLISYTFVNTFDYNNAAGVRIESDPMHAIQLAPGIKLIGNTQNGWQPYIGVNMVWNLLDDSRVTANDIRLPEMSIKPYVQYGVGVQKRFKDRFLAYCQAMIHNGGRNGVSLTGGLRWKVGK